MSKTADTFLLCFQFLYALEGSGGTEFLSKTIKLCCVCGWVFQCIGMCSLLYPVQAPAEGQNPGISEVSEIPLLLFYKSIFHLHFLTLYREYAG